MPGLIDTHLSANIQFVVPRAELKRPLEAFLTFDPNQLPPTTETTVPIYDLREGPASLPSTEVQLDETGYAVILHESACDLGAGLETEAGTEAYIAEAIQLFKRELGATEVVCWNSVIRSNVPEAAKETVEARQLAPEKGLPPAKEVKATARMAHVDQDTDYAEVICRRAAGDDVFQEYSRVQIVNLWRPLNVVTNAPLAVADYRTIAEEDLLVFASAFGTGLGVHHSPHQKWSYIQRQTPSETLALRCYDSAVKEGRARFAAHVACDVVGESALTEPEVPRTSIELRLVVLHK